MDQQNEFICELQFGVCKLWQTIVKSRNKGEGLAFIEERRKLGAVWNESPPERARVQGSGDFFWLSCCWAGGLFPPPGVVSCFRLGNANMLLFSCWGLQVAQVLVHRNAPFRAFWLPLKWDFFCSFSCLYVDPGFWPIWFSPEEVQTSVFLWCPCFYFPLPHLVFRFPSKILLNEVRCKPCWWVI